MPGDSLVLSLTNMRNYYESGATRSYKHRRQLLKAFKKAVLDHQEEINNALYADLKKVREETWVTETGLLLQEINYTLRHLKQWMLPERVSTNLLNLPSSSYLYPSPKGVVLIIGPWNFPLQLLLIPLVGAIAAGNVAVIKPSEYAPATAQIIKKIFDAVFDARQVLTVLGDGAEVVPAMMRDFRFDHIFYTGSIPVGKSIYEMAARDLIPVTLELGGKDPCVVEKDANLQVAARRITVGKFTNAGQMCVSPDYLLVHASVRDKLVDLIIKNIASFYSANDQYGYGKIINEKRFNKLVSYLHEGRVIHGGKHDVASLYIEPTIMDNVSPDADVMREEIFGPILPVFTFNTPEEAITIIQRNPTPLSFYVFSGSDSRQKWWIARVQFGSGCINNTAWQFTNHHLPFGGIGYSGFGGYHGKYTFEVFTHKKAVMKTPVWFDPALKYPPLKGKLNLLKRIVG